MEELFELLMEKGTKAENDTHVRIGIRAKVAGIETAFPVTRPCRSYDALEMEVQGIRNGLDLLLARAAKVFRGPGDRLALEGTAEEIWAALSSMNEKAFMEAFNNLDEAKRREVAEHVLTRCNIFSGNARTFSERYDEESALMN